MKPILTAVTIKLGVEMIHRSLVAVLCLIFANLVAADEQQKYVAGRGELLYSTHCIVCHTSQVHWRDKKLATDWSRLLTEVRHWDGFARLGWTDDDVVAVAKYLNTMHYHYAAPD